jgi:hypothetical protein
LKRGGIREAVSPPNAFSGFSRFRKGEIQGKKYSGQKAVTQTAATRYETFANWKNSTAANQHFPRQQPTKLLAFHMPVNAHYQYHFFME